MPTPGSTTDLADGNGATTVVAAKEAEVQAVRLRLDEERSGERWSTILTIMTGLGEGWVWIDLERVTDDAFGAPPLIKPPGLVRLFLSSATCHAGSTPLLPDHRLIGEDGVSGLLGELVDPGRAVPVLVASRDPADPAGAAIRAAALASAVMGVANVWALEGMATSALSKELGPDLHVFGGAVRTYLPGLSMPDGYPRRHRFARRELFLPHPRRGAQVVARAVVGKAAGARPPLLYRNRISLLPGFARHGGDAEGLLADLVRVEEERDRLQQDLEWAMLEADNAAGEAEEAKARVRWLEQRLAAVGDHVAGTPTPLSLRPAIASGCVEALDLAKTHPNMIEIGDTTGAADDLDQHPKGSVWGRKAWRALRALEGYAGAKAAGLVEGNFLQYCRLSPSGCEVVPAEWVAATESETTSNNPRFREARTFDVPLKVNQAGRVYMDEHIRLEKGSDPAPRMHFWDDTSGATGRIYVGYLGRHLPSFQTN